MGEIRPGPAPNPKCQSADRSSDPAVKADTIPCSVLRAIWGQIRPTFMLHSYSVYVTVPRETWSNLLC